MDPTTTYDELAAILGWQLLHSTGDGFLREPLARQVEESADGVVVQEVYTSDANATLLFEQRRADDVPLPASDIEQLNGFELRITVSGEQAHAIFLTGEDDDDHPIIAELWVSGSPDPRAVLKRFVGSLTF